MLGSKLFVCINDLILKRSSLFSTQKWSVISKLLTSWNVEPSTTICLIVVKIFVYCCQQLQESGYS